MGDYNNRRKLKNILILMWYFIVHYTWTSNAEKNKKANTNDQKLSNDHAIVAVRKKIFFVCVLTF